MSAFYFAAKFRRRHDLKERRAELMGLGHIVTSRWLDQAEDDENSETAAVDLADIEAADCLLSFSEEPRTEGRGGRHCELGIAIGAGKDIVVIGQREHIFCHLPEVHHFWTWYSFIETMKHESLRDVWGGPSIRSSSLRT